MNLRIEHVSKQFGGKLVLADIDLELTSGVYGILGSNGSGKTTLMRILAGVMKPSSGHVYLDGREIAALNHRYRELIGYLPQHVGLYPNFSAEKMLGYIASLKGLTKEDAKHKVDEVLELVGLSEHRKQKVGKFSGGMKRRVGIAQALLNDPKILIVDEPTAGLDPKERIRFRNLLARISTDRIVLLSTHIVSDIEMIAKEILVLKEGRLAAMGTPETLLKGLEGKVWSVLTSDKEMAELQARFTSGNVARVHSQFQMRLISDSKPHAVAKQEAPNLEDLYLYYFDEEAADHVLVQV